MSDVPRFAPNGNKLPERLPVGHRLVDTTKQQWLIGPSIGCGGFGDIYLTRQYDETRDDLKRLTQEHIIKESNSWTNVIKFEHFSGPLFAEINFYIRCARKETVEEYMVAKKLKHLGMPRFVASGIYDPSRDDNPPPVCKSTAPVSVKQPPAKRGKLAQTNGIESKTNGVAKKTNGIHQLNGKQKRITQQVKEKKYRFLVLQRFGDDVDKIWNRAKRRFNMKSAFNIALKVIDTLEYIHSHGYVHADVKASNLLVDWRGEQNIDEQLSNGLDEDLVKTPKRIQNGNGTIKRIRSKSTNSNGKLNGNHTVSGKDSIEPEDQLYLVDFGLVERFYHKDGTHREHVEDQRRANNGTIEFSSRDAHIGAFSRRSDLESLAYNLLYWVSGGRLPWTVCGGKDHQLVEASKKWYMNNLEVFVNYCFNEEALPVDPVKILKGIEVARNGTTLNSASLSEDNSKTPKNSKSLSTKKSSVKASKITSSRSSVSSRASSTSDSIMCAALYDFLSYITKLSFEDEPDYILLKTILINAIGGNQPSTARSARKQRGIQVGIKKTPPKLPECKNPTPAMREILKRMNLGTKKR